MKIFSPASVGLFFKTPQTLPYPLYFYLKINWFYYFNLVSFTFNISIKHQPKTENNQNTPIKKVITQ